jgi:Tol biopolymer transport system component
VRTRDLLFGAIAIVLVIGYGVLGSQAAPLIVPAGTLTPTPARPTATIEAPRVSGTIAFTLRGDVYVLREGKAFGVTSEGRNMEPSLSPDGRTVVFARTEQIDGKREVDGQVVPALVRYTNIVKKDTGGGPETVVLNGLRVRAASGFHVVAWQNGPSLSPDGKKLSIVVDPGDGSGNSDLEIYDFTTGKQLTRLSQGSNLADTSWSPDGKTIAVTSYTLGAPRILLVAADGTRAEPLKVSADGEYYRPSYSPDGAWIVYTLRHPKGGNDVHAVEVKTGRDVALTDDGHSWNGVFSSDGGSVAFLREVGGVIDLYAMEVGSALTGGQPKAAVKLTSGQGIDGGSRPSWGR